MRCIALAALTAAALTGSSQAAETTYVLNSSRHDVLSYAQPEAMLVRDIHLELNVDFSQKTLAGYAELTVDHKDPKAKNLVLDTRDLSIARIEALSGKQWMPVSYTLGKTDALLGAPLSIALPEKARKLRVYYHTAPTASGLQWLSPEQTAGKKDAFMFSQSQAIHARSWVPLQDTPGVRFTYSAHITTPKNLLAVMSADNSKNHERDGDYVFSMPQPIPSYLMAIAVGDLDYHAFSKRTGVYAEPATMPAAVKEFDDTEKMVETTEKLYGPYRWGQYDLLILPPSFPYGGMENPRLSFITPTVIAGDKSLVSVIAHELAHSWSGNLVTNATWGDGWLNEGFTTYVENREMEALYGRERAVMEQVLSYQNLQKDLKEVQPKYQALAYQVDPADGEADNGEIWYDKGSLFLRYLEEKFGRERFDPFLRSWFDKHAFESATTEEFVHYLDKNLLQKHPNVVSLEKVREWIYAQGLPSDAPVAKSDSFAKVDGEREAWLSGKKKAAEMTTADWNFHQWRYLLNTLPASVTAEQMGELDKAFQLTASGNSEIAHAWLKLAIDHGYHAADERLEQYLTTIGRRILVAPLYEELVKTKEGKARALAIYKKARPGYHPITQATLDKLLGVSA